MHLSVVDKNTGISLLNLVKKISSNKFFFKGILRSVGHDIFLLVDIDLRVFAL